MAIVELRLGIALANSNPRSPAPKRPYDVAVDPSWPTGPAPGTGVQDTAQALASVLVGQQHILHLALVPKAVPPAQRFGTGTRPYRVSTDHVEVDVRYRER